MRPQGAQRCRIRIEFERNMVCVQSIGAEGDQRAKRMAPDQLVQDFYAGFIEMRRQIHSDRSCAIRSEAGKV